MAFDIMAKNSVAKQQERRCTLVKFEIVFFLNTESQRWSSNICRLRLFFKRMPGSINRSGGAALKCRSVRPSSLVSDSHWLHGNKYLQSGQYQMMDWWSVDCGCYSESLSPARTPYSPAWLKPVNDNNFGEEPILETVFARSVMPYMKIQ